MKHYKLSPTALNLFKDCPRCFWLDKNENLRRPRGIFPTLPGGMDLVIKKYFDKYRAQGKLPPEIEGKVKGALFSDAPLLEKWRSWRLTNLRYEDKLLNASLSGALDDCLAEGDFYIPIDYKTRGYELTYDPAKYYQTQLDCYCLILESSGYKTKSLSYLIYYWPLEICTQNMVKFNVTSYEIKTDIKAAQKIFENAINLLRADIPQESANCEYCNLIANREAGEHF